MVVFNITSSDPSTFLLLGIPGLEAAYAWISIPFAMCYIIGLLGNLTILLIVCKDQTLHKPMYILLCMMALTDIAMSTFIVPKALCIFWFNLKDITIGGCLTQMFFLHMLSIKYSAILVTMAIDRYIAICHPLRYATILTNGRLAKLGLMGLIRAVSYTLPMPLLLSKLPFCANHMIPNTYCEYMSVAKISCGDITVNKVYGLVAVILVIGCDMMVIGLSYTLILMAVLQISSKKAHHKALNTCIAHICVILVSYSSCLFSNLMHRYGQGMSPPIHIIMSNVYFIIPPTLNPVIYGLKTKELREKVGKHICKR